VDYFLRVKHPNSPCDKQLTEIWPFLVKQVYFVIRAIPLKKVEGEEITTFVRVFLRSVCRGVCPEGVSRKVRRGLLKLSEVKNCPREGKAV